METSFGLFFTAEHFWMQICRYPVLHPSSPSVVNEASSDGFSNFPLVKCNRPEVEPYFLAKQIENYSVILGLTKRFCIGNNPVFALGII